MIPAGLAELVSALLEDPGVRERIEQDPELRELWADPAVQERVSSPAARASMMEAMQMVLEITRGLLADPQVQERIQADPELRDLWADPAVRQRVLGIHQP